MTDQARRCPQCGDFVVKAAKEGGSRLVKPRYVVFPSSGPPVMGCASCGAEIEILQRQGSPLVIRRLCNTPPPR